MHFHSLRVKDVIKETADTVSISFDVPTELKDEFQFIPGQHLTLRQDINGEDVRRSYSICSAPNENELRVAIKQIPEGLFSTYANESIKAGDVLESMPPHGHFYTEYKPENAKNYLAFAAGSGITPILSMVKHVLATEEGSTFTLFYGNKNTESIIFGQELDGIKNTYPTRFNFQLVLSQENRGNDLFYGRIGSDKIEKWSKGIFNLNSMDEIFMCGPEAMTHDIRAYLDAQGVDSQKVHFELFHASGVEEKAAEVTESIAAVTSSVKIIVDDEEYDFELKSKGMDILQAGVEAGVDLPFSCKGGVCCTCRAKLLEGEATMAMNYALLPEEVEEGYILTCQAHPTTERVVVSFDD